MTLRHLPLHDGWTLGADGPVPLELPTGGVPATVPGLRPHRSARRRSHRRPVPGRQRDPARPGSAGPTGRTAPPSTGRPTATTAPTSSSTGLDTVATVLLNGTELGRTANQHRGYRFAVRPLLVEGANTVEVRFTAPYTYAEELRERLGDRPGAYAEPYPFIRKMACNFGWDWGPDPGHLRHLAAGRPAVVDRAADRLGETAGRPRGRRDAPAGRDPGRGPGRRREPVAGRPSRWPANGPGSPSRPGRTAPPPLSSSRTPSSGGRTATASSPCTT